MITNARTTCTEPIKLSGINGANPLGFLSALGVLAVLSRSGYPKARLWWERSVAWIPVLDCGFALDPIALCETLAVGLRGQAVDNDAEGRRAETQHAFDAAKKAVNDKQKEIKKRRLRGKEKRAAEEAELLPLEVEEDQKRRAWLEALKNAVPRGELAIGKHINCTGDEYREHANAFIETADCSDRETLDLVAAFGSDASLEKAGRITATPFCFITGSGHQYFLDTVRQLTALVTPEGIHAALFKTWSYRDEGLSMRWDPAEDRRYALMARDPTASDNKPRTVWMANLLAYVALAFFPSASRGKRLRTAGWADGPSGPIFTWPIWERPADLHTIRSLLALRELIAESPDRADLLQRGVVAAFRSRRIQVGNAPLFKINFSPARCLFAQAVGKP
jgi:hypothetical protein